MPRRSVLATSVFKAALAAALIAAALVGSAVRPATAEAATPCWKVLLNDWYDGRIDQTYAVHCYKDALKHLPSDVSTYSSAHDDILRALQSAITKQKHEHKNVGNNTLVPPEWRRERRRRLGRIRWDGWHRRNVVDVDVDDNVDERRAPQKRQRGPGRHGRIGQRVFDPGAAADPRRSRSAARRGRRRRSGREAHPVAPPRRSETEARSRAGGSVRSSP